MINILLQSKFQPSDVITHILNPDFEFIVTSLTILNIDETGQANIYAVNCSDGEGKAYCFYPYEIKKVSGGQAN